eukprot:349686-Chlamydomonas_euryale.AAC.7
MRGKQASRPTAYSSAWAHVIWLMSSSMLSCGAPTGAVGCSTTCVTGDARAAVGLHGGVGRAQSQNGRRIQGPAARVVWRMACVVVPGCARAFHTSRSCSCSCSCWRAMRARKCPCVLMSMLACVQAWSVAPVRNELCVWDYDHGISPLGHVCVTMTT